MKRPAVETMIEHDTDSVRDQIKADMEGLGPFDADTYDATQTVFQRAGANSYWYGYSGDARKPLRSLWFATVRIGSHELTAGNYPDPLAATDMLARKMLEESMCNFCGNSVTLGDERGHTCRWRRMGDEWIRGCTQTHHERIVKS